MEDTLTAEAERIRETFGLDSVAIVVTGTQNQKTFKATVNVGNLYATLSAASDALDHWSNVIDEWSQTT